MIALSLRQSAGSNSTANCHMAPSVVTAGDYALRSMAHRRGIVEIGRFVPSTMTQSELDDPHQFVVCHRKHGRDVKVLLSQLLEHSAVGGRAFS